MMRNESALGVATRNAARRIPGGGRTGPSVGSGFYLGDGQVFAPVALRPDQISIRAHRIAATLKTPCPAAHVVGGNLAGFAGPFAMGWIKDHTGSYTGGLLLLSGLGIIAMPHAKSVVVAMAVRLGAATARLPEPAFYPPPPGIKPVRPVPLIMVKAAAASTPARIRAALAAFSQGQFRDTFNPKSPT